MNVQLACLLGWGGFLRLFVLGRLLLVNPPLQIYQFPIPNYQLPILQNNPDRYKKLSIRA
ncbi:hypothetical protein ON021_24750 [Microcoleus sp. HI-ES]|nr:hypothetical protein [Microcoleus sp. HI-ES]